ncbi:MAG TPA: hypothetical protein VJH95_05715 [Candidatus Nanoarchaeia archaeon]|nr:hypothetical protein [Candidatus Nanoarchaeia archaeon]
MVLGSKQSKKLAVKGGLTTSQPLNQQPSQPLNQQPSQPQAQQKTQHDQQDPIKLLLKELIQKYDIKKEDILEAFEPENDPTNIPISIFNTKELSSLEAISKYLHEELHLKFSQIAQLTNRNPRTVWSAYQSSKTKHPSQLTIKQSEIKIPIHQLTDRSLSVLEAIVSYLKENYNLTLHEIAQFLNRDDRTIWTVYHRYKKKVMLHG